MPRPVVVIVLVLGLLLTAPAAGAGAADSVTCPIPVETSAASGPAVEPPVELTVASQSNEVLNFSDGRGTKSRRVVLKASEPLPASVTPDQFELTMLTTMQRIGSDSLESTELGALSYSQPRIVDGRRQVVLNICVDAGGGKPGTYTGQVLISGPRGVSSTTLTQTAQLKSEKPPFLLILLGILVLAAFFLWFKVGRDLEKKDIENKGRTRIVILAFSLLIAGGTMYGIYNENPAWGADLFASAAALLGTAFAAIGLGSGLSGALQAWVDDSP